MNALVTGAAGFIGSQIAEALCRKGVKVFALDNFSLGSAANLAWKRPDDQLEVVEADIRDALRVGRLVSDCDWVFHHAAVPSVPLSVEMPVETNEQNLNATLELLKACRDGGVKRFVFASSSAVYGDSDALSKSETDATNPLSPYALQKYAGEKYGQLFFQLYGLETVSLRYFNVFGPRQSYDSPYSGVIAKFCTALLGGHQPRVYGDGLQSRDFTPVKNVVNANLAAAAAPAAAVAGKVFNIGTGESVTILELLREIQSQTGSESDIQFCPERAGDVRNSRANISAARLAFGYEPEVSWQEGLRETLQFYRQTRTDNQ